MAFCLPFRGHQARSAFPLSANVRAPRFFSWYKRAGDPSLSPFSSERYNKPSITHSDGNVRKEKKKVQNWKSTWAHFKCFALLLLGMFISSNNYLLIKESAYVQKGRKIAVLSRITKAGGRRLNQLINRNPEIRIIQARVLVNPLGFAVTMVGEYQESRHCPCLHQISKRSSYKEWLEMKPPSPCYLFFVLVVCLLWTYKQEMQQGICLSCLSY